MLVENDYVLREHDLSQVTMTLNNYISDDWNILRFDSWGVVEVKVNSRSNPLMIDMATNFKSRQGNKPVEFYGGTHMMLWRGTRRQKIESHLVSRAIYYIGSLPERKGQPFEDLWRLNWC
jgi:hypothetical protein